MDYKELHEEIYLDLFAELGREPTWQEIECSFQDAMDSLIELYKV